MAENTIPSTNINLIAQEALAQLNVVLPFLSQIAKDCSDARANFNDTITIQEVQGSTAIDFNQENGYVATPKTIVNIPVPLNKHKHHTYSVSVAEASSTSVDLVQRLSLGGAYALGSAIVTDLCALITAANFPNKSIRALGAGLDGFDRKAMVMCGVPLSKRGVIPISRFMLLNSDYFGSLMSDTSMLTLLALQGFKNIGESGLPDIHGFKPSEYGTLPENDENLMGFCGGRTALGFATRLPTDPGEGQSNITISSVKDEQTGISIQTREWYNPDKAKYLRSYTLMYGVGKGQSDAGQRIVSK